MTQHTETMLSQEVFVLFIWEGHGCLDIVTVGNLQRSELTAFFLCASASIAFFCLPLIFLKPTGLQLRLSSVSSPSHSSPTESL